MYQNEKRKKILGPRPLFLLRRPSCGLHGLEIFYNPFNNTINGFRDTIRWRQFAGLFPDRGAGEVGEGWWEIDGRRKRASRATPKKLPFLTFLVHFRPSTILPIDPARRELQNILGEK